MSWWAGYITGAVVVWLYAIVGFNMPFVGKGSRDECRAAHLGFECVLGWVPGDKFADKP